MSGPRRLAEFAKLRKQVASETVSHGICIPVRIRNSFLLESGLSWFSGDPFVPQCSWPLYHSVDVFFSRAAVMLPWLQLELIGTAWICLPRRRRHL
jgi:hypothetical protein